MRTLIFLSLFAIFSFVLYNYTSAENFDAASLIVQVKDADGYVVSSAFVMISNGGTPQSGYTAPNGKIIFTISTGGTYTVCGTKNNLSDVEYYSSSIPPALHYVDLTVIQNGGSCPIGGSQP